MKKMVVFLSIILALMLYIPVENVFATNPVIQIIMNSTNLYESPDLNSEIITIIPHKTKLEVLDTITNNSYTFYKVEFNYNQGYIFANHATTNESPKRYLDYNGYVKSNEAELFALVENSYNTIKTKLKKDHQIRILDGYDSKKEFTLISYEIDDTIYTHYIKTADIHANGVNKSIIISISLIISCVSIILVLFGSNLKKKRKNI